MSINSQLFQSSTERVAQALHDARAPLAAIKIALRARKENLTDASELKAISEQAMIRLESILADLRPVDYRDGMQALTSPLFDDKKPTIAEVIAKIVAEKKSTLHFDIKREVKIVQKLDQTSHELSAAGPTSYLERSISNILDNAIEATPSDRDVNIQILSTCENGEASISISDTGIGIPETIVSLIGRAPLTFRKEGGSGRGLYFVNRFLQSVDGVLEILNIQKGVRRGGTQVTMRIPVLH